MPKISNIFDLLKKLESVDITVHQARCAVVRNRNASCMKCADACTSGCISIVDDELVINPENCIGCGTCATVCPTCALEAHNPTDGELSQSALKALEATGGEAVFVCEQKLAKEEEVFDPEKLVGVVCLGRVEEALLTSLVVAGAGHISLVKANCEECDYHTGLTTAEAVCKTTNILLEAWNSDVRANIVEEIPAVSLVEELEYDSGRREFFTGMFKGAKNTAAEMADSAFKDAMGEKEEVKEDAKPRYTKVGKDGSLPHFLPTRREQLIENLKALGEPQDVLVETRLWAHAVIDKELCNDCQMCATFCPTGAISKIPASEGVFGVDITPNICVKCCCCTDICKEKALWLSDEVFAVDIPSGNYERVLMVPLDEPLGGPHSIYNAMRKKFSIEEVYER